PRVAYCQHRREPEHGLQPGRLRPEFLLYLHGGIYLRLQQPVGKLHLYQPRYLLASGHDPEQSGIDGLAVLLHNGNAFRWWWRWRWWRPHAAPGELYQPAAG